MNDFPPLTTVKAMGQDEDGFATIIEWESAAYALVERDAEAYARYQAIQNGTVEVTGDPDLDWEGFDWQILDQPRPVLEVLRTWHLGPVVKEWLRALEWLQMDGEEQYDAAITEERFAELQAWMNQP